jgi:hypothetical protein
MDRSLRAAGTLTVSLLILLAICLAVVLFER